MKDCSHLSDAWREPPRRLWVSQKHIALACLQRLRQLAQQHIAYRALLTRRQDEQAGTLFLMPRTFGLQH